MTLALQRHFLLIIMCCFRGFDKLHPDFINHLKKNITALRSVLLSHVIPGSWYSPGLQDGQEFKTVIGYKVKVEIKKEGKRKQFICSI